MRLTAIGAAGIALVLPLQLAPLPQWLLDSKAPAGFLAADVAVGADTVLISDAPLFGAVAWSFGRDDVYVLSEGEIAYGLAYPESRHRSLDDGAARRARRCARGRHGHDPARLDGSTAAAGAHRSGRAPPTQRRRDPAAMSDLILLAAVALLSLSQVLQKLGAKRRLHGTIGARQWIVALFSPELIAAGIAIVTGTLLWLYVLYEMDVSRAFPF